LAGGLFVAVGGRARSLVWARDFAASALKASKRMRKARRRTVEGQNSNDCQKKRGAACTSDTS